MNSRSGEVLFIRVHKHKWTNVNRMEKLRGFQSTLNARKTLNVVELIVSRKMVVGNGSISSDVLPLDGSHYCTQMHLQINRSSQNNDISVCVYRDL